MKIRKEREKRFNYESFIETIENEIKLMEAKEFTSELIMKELKRRFEDILAVTDEKYYAHLSSKMIDAIDRISNGLTVSEAYILIKSALAYTSKVSTRRRVMNAFTIIEYYYYPDKLDKFKQNWKQLMQPGS